MQFPLELSFKILALANQIYIRDAGGNLSGYVKQKMFKLKEDINIFADEQQTTLLYNIKADRVIDFSANYRFTNAAGQPLGSIKRQGMRSIFKAHYDVSDSSGAVVFSIKEENGWIKVLDALVGELPIIGMSTGYLLHPAYRASDGSHDLARMEKQPAFFEGKFRLEKLQASPEQEQLILLSFLMLTLLERARG